VYIKQEDPDLPTYNFDPIINPIAAYKVERNKNAVVTEIEMEPEELEEIEIPEDF
jgi:hypothetical protein